jgi:hypothetical protein
MSVIMPAGKDRFEWVPKDLEEKKMVKTASSDSETEEVAEIVEASDSNEALYNAAKEVVEAMDADKCAECDCCPCECPTEAGAACLDEEVTEIGGEEIGGEEIGEVSEGGDPVEQAVEKLEDAVEEVKDAVGVESAEEVEVEVEVEGPEVPEGDELVVESTPEIEGCGTFAGSEEKEAKEGEASEEETVEAASEEKEEKEGEASEEETVEAASEEKEEKEGEASEEETVEASTEEVGMDKSASAEEFCKYAKISPANRSKIKDYWKNMLGYPSDYVELMTKDWE